MKMFTSNLWSPVTRQSCTSTGATITRRPWNTWASKSSGCHLPVSSWNETISWSLGSWTIRRSEWAVCTLWMNSGGADTPLWPSSTSASGWLRADTFRSPTLSPRTKVRWNCFVHLDFDNCEGVTWLSRILAIDFKLFVNFINSRSWNIEIELIFIIRLNLNWKKWKRHPKVDFQSSSRCLFDLMKCSRSKALMLVSAPPRSTSSRFFQ